MSNINLSGPDLLSMTQTVCDTFLGIDVVPTPLEGIHLESEVSLTACVLISGAWRGAVTVQVSEALARTVAAGMFAMDQSELSNEEIQDALGEVANVLGGNVKGLIDGSCKLSLPTVAEGKNHRFMVARSRLVHATACRMESEPLIVSVLEHDEE